MSWLYAFSESVRVLVSEMTPPSKNPQRVVERRCSSMKAENLWPVQLGHVVVVALDMHAAMQPGLSKGLAVRRFTVPPMLPSSAEASEDLSTSAPEITSDGSTSKARSRASSSVARIRLLSVTMLYCGSKPRTLTLCPSPPVVRLMVMPGRCCSESATSASGKRPSSSALMESSTTVAFFLISSDFRDWPEARSPRSLEVPDRLRAGVGRRCACRRSCIRSVGRERRRSRSEQSPQYDARIRINSVLAHFCIPFVI